MLHNILVEISIQIIIYNTFYYFSVLYNRVSILPTCFICCCCCPASVHFSVSVFCACQIFANRFDIWFDNLLSFVCARARRPTHPARTYFVFNKLQHNLIWQRHAWPPATATPTAASVAVSVSVFASAAGAAAASGYCSCHERNAKNGIKSLIRRGKILSESILIVLIKSHHA